ncbi:MAG: IS66 family transposase [Acidobacteriota bacterium]|nr:IS66 family transposase [Acidobacteriota bacterium]
MIRIESEQNVEVLRQVALLLDREVHTLHNRIEKLITEIVRLRGGDASALQLELEQLQELLARREQELFGNSSEKRPRPRSEEPPVESPPQRGHGPRPQPSLPLFTQLHELPEEKRECPGCGGCLTEMNGQFEESEEITVVERSFRVVVHQRQKYRCRCNASVVTAPGPSKLVPGGRYSPEFAAEVAISKYLDHCPLERQVRIMDREGLQVDSQTLWDQIDVLARHLEPTYQAIAAQVLTAPVVYADETYWRMMDGRSSRWWVWCVASDEAVSYRLCGTRSAKAANLVLSGYQGIVMADGYGAYSSLARPGPGFTLVHCWAHIRRKFVEIESNYPAACAEVLDLIGKLYAVEREAARADNSETAQALALRARLREEQSRELIDAIRKWAESQLALPQSGLGKALAYMRGLWPGLTRFLADPRIPLDNNCAERALRGVVVGRKNHYGSRSRRGTEVAALFYSLCESAKIAGVEPRAYLLRATHAALETPGTVTLPHSQIDATPTPAAAR